MTTATPTLLWFVWGLERYRFWLQVPGTLLWTAAGAVPLLTGVVLQRAFDALSAGGAMRSLTPLIAVVLALAASRMALYLGGVFVDLTYRYHLRTLIRRNVLDHLLRRATDSLPAPVGDVINRLYQDTHESEELVAQLLFQMLTVVQATVAVIVLVRIDAPLTLVALLPVLGAATLAQAAAGRLERLRAGARQATGQVAALLGEVFGGIQAIQAARAEAPVIAHFRRLSETRQRMALTELLFAQVVAAVQGNTVALATGVLLLLAARSIRAGTFTVGDLALFVVYLDWLNKFARTMGNYARQYRQRGVSVQRLVALLGGERPEALVRHAPISLHSQPPATTPPLRTDADTLHRIEVTDLASLPGRSGRAGIVGLHFTATAGTLTVITGRTGSGKTTALRLLLGLTPAARGQIRWNGEAIGDPATFFVPPRCVYVPQAPHLFSDKLRHNVLLALRQEDVDLDGAMQLAEMQRDLSAMPQGLETEVGSRGVRLSGGQVQRTAVARAVVRDPSLLVLDDPTSALDIETERALWQNLKQRALTTGATILAASHRRAALEAADQIVVLEHGIQVATGPLEVLLQTCEELREIWSIDREVRSPA